MTVNKESLLQVNDKYLLLLSVLCFLCEFSSVGFMLMKVAQLYSRNQVKNTPIKSSFWFIYNKNPSFMTYIESFPLWCTLFKLAWCFLLSFMVFTFAHTERTVRKELASILDPSPLLHLLIKTYKYISVVVHCSGAWAGSHACSWDAACSAAAPLPV